MTTEQSLWRYIREGMEGRWHGQRHEDKLARGVPDVSYGIELDDKPVNGWLELKQVNGERFKNPGLSLDQVRWLEKRGATGGRCYLLVGTTDAYYLFPWNVVYLLFEGESEWEEVVGLASAIWDDHINFNELAAELHADYY